MLCHQIYKKALRLIGEIEPENVVTQGIFVDYIVDGGKL